MWGSKTIDYYVKFLMSIYDTVQSVATMSKFPSVSKGQVLGFTTSDVVNALATKNIKVTVSGIFTQNPTEML